MANLTETAVWESGVFQNETNTRWTGGPDGSANRQFKQLANRTLWLKQFADEVAAARGGKTNLDTRLDQYDAFDPAGVAALYAFAAMGIDLAGLANREARKTVRQRIQSGTARIVNRGVVSGCTVSKSSGAVRNLSLAAGTFFMNGQEYCCPGAANAALVPANTENASRTCYAYLFFDSARDVRFAATAFGESVPEDGIALYRITVPAGNTGATDPNLASVTLTDVRRVEAGYPMRVNSTAYASVALPYPMLDNDYTVLLDVQSAKGGWNQRGTVYAGDKAANGFKVYAEGSIDAVSVRWTAVKLSL